MKRSERSLIHLMMVCMVFAILTPCLQVAQGQSDYRPWPMLNGNHERTGLSPFNLSNNSGSLKWRYDLSSDQVLGNDEEIPSSPIIGPNDTVYFQSGTKLYALSYKGELLWSKDLGGHTGASPAVGADGTVYALGNGIYAFNKDGSQKWTIPLDFRTGGIHSGIGIGDDGTIYFKGNDRTIYAVYPSGTIKWKFTPIDGNDTSPAIGPDGTVYACQQGAPNNQFLYAIDSNGKLIWSVGFPGQYGFTSSPSVDANGTIYVTSYGDLTAIAHDGKIKWSFQTDSKEGSLSSPTIGPHGSIYFTDYIEKTVYSVSPQGTKNWKADASKWGNLTSEFVHNPLQPTIGHDGIILVPSFQVWDNDTDQTSLHSIFALNPNGTLRWSYNIPGEGTSPPAIGSDGTIYMGSQSSGLYAIGTNGSVFQEPNPEPSGGTPEPEPVPVDPPEDTPTNDDEPTPGDPPTNDNTPSPLTPPEDTPEKIVPLVAKVEPVMGGMVVFSISTVLICSVLLSTEAGRYSVLSFASMFYSKKKKEEILDNFIRGQLYGRISESPGLSLSELSRKVGRPTGTIVYHLRTLEREGLIKTCKRGLNRLFFSSSVIIPEGFLDLKPFQRLLLTLIEKNPGISQQKLSKLTQVSAPTINRHIHELEERSFIMVSKGSSTRCYILESG